MLPFDFMTPPLFPQVHLLQALMLVLFTILFLRWLIAGFQLTCLLLNQSGKTSSKTQLPLSLFTEFL